MKVLIKVLKLLFYTIMVFLLTVNIFNIISIKVLKKDFPNIFGFTYFEIASNSMYPELKKGDLVIIDLKEENYKIGDIITYQDHEIYTTHRLIGIKDNIYTTKGDSNNTNDPLIKKEQVIGKVIFKLTYVGYLIYLVKKPITIIFAFLTILMYFLKK